MVMMKTADVAAMAFLTLNAIVKSLEVDDCDSSQFENGKEPKASFLSEQLAPPPHPARRTINANKKNLYKVT
jgi:hypothetical protein